MSRGAFVTGASGFLGANLVRELLARDYRVTALLRKGSEAPDLEGLPITIVRGDVTDADSLRAALPADTDTLFHAAADTSVWSGHRERQQRVNVGGTGNIVELVAQANVRRLVHVSTFAVYGFHQQPIDENSAWQDNAGNINYVVTKRAAEMLVREAVSDGRIDAVVLNPAHILGPFDRHNWSRMLLMVHNGTLPGVPPGSGSFADVREVARAAVNAAESAEKGQRYLLGGANIDYLDLIRQAGGLLQRKVPGRSTPAWVLRGVARLRDLASRVTGREPDLTPEGVAMITHHMHCNSGHAMAQLDYRLTPMEQLLADTCQWLRQAGLLGNNTAKT